MLTWPEAKQTMLEKMGLSDINFADVNMDDLLAALKDIDMAEFAGGRGAHIVLLRVPSPHVSTHNRE
jgi:hypothetical protein